MRIPMLAIHLNRDILSEGFKMNKQTHLVPVLASAVKKAANKPAANAEADSLVDGQSKRQKVDGAALVGLQISFQKQLRSAAEHPQRLPASVVQQSLASHQVCQYPLRRPIPWPSRSNP